MTSNRKKKLNPSAGEGVAFDRSPGRIQMVGPPIRCVQTRVWCIPPQSLLPPSQTLDSSSEVSSDAPTAPEGALPPLVEELRAPCGSV